MKRILMSPPAIALAILGLVGALTVGAVALPGPLLDDNPSTPGDVSGPCDEAEHANDPRCADIEVSTPDASAPDAESSSTDDNPSSPGDVSGPCDEAEHFDDPRCAGTDVPAPTPTTPVSATPADGMVTAGPAGSVAYSFDGASFTVGEVLVEDGWTAIVEQAGGLQVEVKFLKGTVRIDVEVELEHGQVRERVRTRDEADDSETRVENGIVTRSDDGSDDNSGSGHGSDDVDDDSGSGHGSDDSDDADDDSGSGHGSDDSGSGSDNS